MPVQVNVVRIIFQSKLPRQLNSPTGCGDFGILRCPFSAQGLRSFPQMSKTLWAERPRHVALRANRDSHGKKEEQELNGGEGAGQNGIRTEHGESMDTGYGCFLRSNFPLPLQDGS